MDNIKGRSHACGTFPLNRHRRMTDDLNSSTPLPPSVLHRFDAEARYDASYAILGLQMGLGYCSTI